MATSMRGAMGTSTTLLLSTDLWWVQLMARTQPGVADEQARTSLDALLGAAVRGTMTVDKGSTLPRLQIEDGSRGLDGAAKQYAQSLYLLLAMVATVLLLACANTANLMLARAAARQREMSVRLALGASQWRILRQVLTESLLLSGASGALGFILGYAGRNVLPRLVAHSWEAAETNIPFNGKVFVFTAGITIGTGILFGVFPAWAATRAEVGVALKQATPAVSRRRKPWSGKAIVTFQVALSTLLVVAAALFLRTLIKLDKIEPGFNTHHLQMFELSLPASRYAPPKDIGMQTMLEAQLRGVPGVEGVTASNPPLLSGMMMSTGFFIEGAPETHVSLMEKPGEQDNFPLAAHVGNDFFRVMQLPMLAGRSFNPQDTETSPAVSVINQSLARKFFPNQNPIGKRFSQDPDPKGRKWIQIVGVCADSLYNSMRNNPRPVHFEPFRQQGADNMTYIVRTALPAKSIVPSLTAVVHRLDPDLPLMNVRTQDQQIDDSLQQERMFASLTAGFALLALSLALVGIYGIMSYTVAQRRSEIGIRLALGARRQQVRGMVLREAGWLAVLGVAAGMATALALRSVVKSMLFGLQPNDPTSLAGAATLLLAVALFAGWLPAARASSVEPMEALRHE